MLAQSQFADGERWAPSAQSAQGATIPPPPPPKATAPMQAYQEMPASQQSWVPAMVLIRDGYAQQMVMQTPSYPMMMNGGGMPDGGVMQNVGRMSNPMPNPMADPMQNPMPNPMPNPAPNGGVMMNHVQASQIASTAHMPPGMPTMHHAQANYIHTLSQGPAPLQTSSSSDGATPLPIFAPELPPARKEKAPKKVKKKAKKAQKAQEVQSAAPVQTVQNVQQVQMVKNVPNVDKVVVHLQSSGTLFSSALAPEVPDRSKAAQCWKIYELMVRKRLTSPKGYLIFDVFAEVAHEKGDDYYGIMWPFVKHRFVSLLRSAPLCFDFLGEAGPKGILRVALRPFVGEAA
jgi:hypothetical protein